MTERPYVVLQGSVEIVTGLNDVIILDDGAGDITATVAPGTYLVKGTGEADDLLFAMTTALDASASTRTFTAAIAANIDPTLPGFIITITSSASVTLQWTDALTTFPWAEAGFTANSTGTTHAATMCPVWCWVADQPMRLNKPQFGGDTAQTLMGAGQVYSTERGGPYEARALWFEGIDGARTLYELAQLAADTQQDSFQTWWELHRDGRHFRLEFATVSSGTVLEARGTWTHVATRSGDGFNWVLDKVSCDDFDPEQPEVGMDLYNWKLVLRQYVE